MADTSLKSWAQVARAEASVSPFGFSAAHLDHINTPVVGNGISIAALLEEVEAHLDLAPGTGAVQLAVPLGFSGVLDLEVPERLSWPSEGSEPPSLYYFDPRHWFLASDREEYRCPSRIAELSAHGLEATYACGRAIADRAKGWEFTKTLWIRSEP